MNDNFVPHLFSQIEVKKHNTLIDDIEFPGIASTIKVCVEYPGLNVYNGKALTSVLFLQPTLMHNSITTRMSHYYPRHVSGLDVPILRRNVRKMSGCECMLSGI